MKRSALLGLLALTVVGCSDMTAGSRTAKTSVATVKRQALTGYTFFDGKLVVPDSAKGVCYSPYDTQVVEVYTVAGKEVDKGQTLAKLNIPGTDSAKAAAKAQKQSAGAAYSDERAEKSGPVVEAKKTLQEARDAEAAARDTVASGGDADVEAAVLARKDAERVLAQAQRELDESLRSARESVANAQSTLAAVREAERKGLIIAPISGTVVSLDAKPGMTALANQAMATIVNFNAVRVQGLVPADLKDKVKVGTDVLVAFNGISADPIDAEVREITVAAPREGQSSGGYLAVIAFKSPGSIVQPDATVKRIGVKTGYVEDALVVPVAALHTKDGKSWVTVKEGEKWSNRPVETGMSDGALIQVTSGLKEGDQVRIETLPGSEKGP